MTLSTLDQFTRDRIRYHRAILDARKVAARLEKRLHAWSANCPFGIEAAQEIQRILAEVDNDITEPAKVERQMDLLELES